MKKILLLCLCAALLLSLAACGGSTGGGNAAVPESPSAQPTPEVKPGDTKSLEEIVAAIGEGVEGPMTENLPLTEENFDSFLFIDYIDGAEAIASQAAINAIAHLTVVLRLPEGADAAKVAKDIEDNANPNKWICVTAEKVIVSVHNQTILLVMSTVDTADAMAANFDSLWA
jgi:hypothetical protein